MNLVIYETSYQYAKTKNVQHAKNKGIETCLLLSGNRNMKCLKLLIIFKLKIMKMYNTNDPD